MDPSHTLTFSGYAWQSLSWLALAAFKLIYISRDNLKIDKIYKKTYLKHIQRGKLYQKALFLIWFFAPDYQKTI